jgi:hypothetical protein
LSFGRSAALLGALLLLGCSRAELERIPVDPPARNDKIHVSGGLCTAEPETLIFPLRVLFIVDGSVSMETSDPPDPVTGETGREKAVREAWSSLLDRGIEDVRVGILRFASEAQSRTASDLDGDDIDDTYFSADREQLEAATEALAETSRTTNYANALSEAYFEIHAELRNAPKESLPLSKFVVIFLSDGLPDTEGDEDQEKNRPTSLLEAVESIAEVARLSRVGDFSFHTAYLSSGLGPVLDQDAQSLLAQMAETGGGTFRSFPAGERLDFVDIDFSIIRRVFTLRSLVALNLNALNDGDQLAAALGRDLRASHGGGEDAGTAPTADTAPAPDTDASTGPRGPTFVDLDGDGEAGCGEPLVDTDGDGLADATELAVGSDPFVKDTDDDGLDDWVEWQFRDNGFDPTDGEDASCFVASRCHDRDSDGHCDCVLDGDADGVCDCAEKAELGCVDLAGHDCLDGDGDGFCDCPDRDGDGRCDFSDTDGDGLSDCAELYLGTAANGADSDADGLPDPVEIRYRTSAIDADELADLDLDNVSNGTEARTATDPLCDDSVVRSRVAYSYSLRTLGLQGARTCYEFDIRNVTMMPTMANEGAERPGNGWNRVLLFAGEVAFDDPGAFARYRVACVEARYDLEKDMTEPEDGRFVLEERDFVDMDGFDADDHCKRPE